MAVDRLLTAEDERHFVAGELKDMEPNLLTTDILDQRCCIVTV